MSKAFKKFEKDIKETFETFIAECEQYEKEHELVLRNCVIFDIDNTISDDSHRQHFLLQNPKNWTGYFEEMYADPETAIGKVVRTLQKHYSLILFTGRSEKYRETTERWLKNHCIKFVRLYMRKEKDFRSNLLIKKDFLRDVLKQGFNPLFIVDDNSAVEDMFFKVMDK